MVRSESIEQWKDSDPVPLVVQLEPADRLAASLEADDVLAINSFGARTAVDVGNPKKISLGLGILDGSGDIEVWRCAAPVTQGRIGRIGYTCNGQVLFGHLPVENRRGEDLAFAVERAYREIGAFLEQSSYSRPFRIWNYIPRINGIENGLERYRSFCVGRYKGVMRRPVFGAVLPAASAIGCAEGACLISFLASRVRPVQIENPRQISAFRYPPVYSPRSPLFSRAAWMRWNSGDQLYLSGTASIVGHETLHTDNVIAQAVETCQNIDAVLEQYCKCKNDADKARLNASGLRVYLRRPEQLEKVKAALEGRLEVSGSIVYVKGEICRSELLLEIEGVFMRSGAVFR